MNCARVRDILPLYAESDLDPVESESVARHLDDCDECRAHLDLDRELATALATLTPRRRDARVRTLRTRTWTAIERRQMANDYAGRNFERPDKSWEWRISVVGVAARRVLAERGFSGSGAPAFVSFVGIWRSGSWQQGP